jgi:DNA-binding transcriptional LysR family regulator
MRIRRRVSRQKGGGKIGGAAKKGGKGMDLKDLRFFIAVYETKGFSRASEALGTVQSNVSARIIELERSIGEPLFERQWRKVIPTPKGEKLYAYAKHFLAQFQHAERTFRA